MTKEITHWVVVANAHQAKIFSKIANKKSSPFLLIKEMKADLDSNHEKSGTGFSSAGGIRHGMDPHTDRRQVGKEKFAREIEKVLAQALNEKQYENLVLVISPSMAGAIESVFDKNLQNVVVNRLNKDIAEYSAQEAIEYLAENL